MPNTKLRVIVPSTFLRRDYYNSQNKSDSAFPFGFSALNDFGVQSYGDGRIVEFASTNFCAVLIKTFSKLFRPG